jgi:hypothetical protein
MECVQPKSSSSSQSQCASQNCFRLSNMQNLEVLVGVVALAGLRITTQNTAIFSLSTIAGAADAESSFAEGCLFGFTPS